MERDDQGKNIVSQTPLPPLRVLYVLKRFPQTSQTFVLCEVLELERAGVVVGIDALGADPGGPQHRDLDRLRASVRHVPRRGLGGDRVVLAAHLRCGLRAPLRYLRTAQAARHGGRWRRFLQAGVVADRARRQRYDVLHAHFATAAAEVAGDAAALAGRPFTITAHAKDIFQHDNATALRQRVERAAAVVTVSSYNADHLDSLFLRQPIHVINNAVALEPPAPRPAAGPLLCVARLVDKKGVDTLLRAMAVLSQRGDGPRLEVIGDGERAAALHALAEKLGLSEQVRFLGAQASDEVDAAYRRCSIFVLPCRISADGDRDGMPTVIIEAMARAIPVISTDTVGISEVVEHGVTGLLTPAEDVDALAVAIEKLWDDPALGRAMGDAGRRVVAERFDPATSARALHAVWRSATEQCW